MGRTRKLTCLGGGILTHTCMQQAGQRMQVAPACGTPQQVAGEVVGLVLNEDC